MREGTELRLSLASAIVAMNCIDIVFDAWILTLPMPIIKKLHMTSGRKIAVAGVFLLGALYVFSIVDVFVDFSNARIAAWSPLEYDSTTVIFY